MTTNKLALLLLTAILVSGGYIVMRNSDRTVLNTKFAELTREFTGGISAMWNGGTPLCDSEFATHLVSEAVDNSELVTKSSTHAHSAGVSEIVNGSFAGTRNCRGTVVLTDGSRIAVGYAIVPNGFHRFLVNVSATISTANASRSPATTAQAMPKKSR